jgi:hypothetical protein
VAVGATVGTSVGGGGRGVSVTPGVGEGRASVTVGGTGIGVAVGEGAPMLQDVINSATIVSTRRKWVFITTSLKFRFVELPCGDSLSRL